LLDLEREQRVGARATEIDCRDRLAQPLGLLAQPVARVRHQRRPDDEHRIAVVDRRRRRHCALPRNAAAEEDDVRFDDRHRNSRIRESANDIEIARVDVGVARRERRVDARLNVAFAASSHCCISRRAYVAPQSTHVTRPMLP
jgi:hypothetical protein